MALVQRARRTSSAWRRTPSERRPTGQNCYFFSARAVRRACVTGALLRETNRIIYRAVCTQYYR